MRRTTPAGSCDRPQNPRPHNPRTGRPCSWRYMGDDSTRLLKACQSWQITCSMTAGPKPDTSYLWNGLSEMGLKLVSYLHNRPYPSRLVGGFTNPITNLVLQGLQSTIAFDFSAESLKEGTINAVVGHPLEVALHCSRVAGREKFCRLTV